MRRLGFVILLLGVAAVGCTGRTALVPRLAPETTVFVQGDVDTVNHVVEIFWFGTDPDGVVAFYELRLLNPAAPAESAWVRTTRTDSTFTVFTPTGSASPVFEVRAIDNDGLIDATPARQRFFFDNEPPTVMIGSYPQPSSETYASLTLSWTASDPDGESSIMRFRVWLDGNEANPHILSGMTYTIPTADFFEGPEVRSGTRTVFVQPIDDGGLVGETVSRSWTVRPTVTGPPGTRARLLLIDDVSTLNTLNTRTDTLWANAVANQLEPGTWSVLRLQTVQPFQSPEDARQTFSLYDAVIWYRGTESTFSNVLRDVQGGIAAAVEDGHSFLVEGLNLVDGIGRSGPLEQDFVSRVYETDYLYKFFTSGMEDSSVSWGVNGGAVFRSSTDSLRIAIITLGLRGFAVRDTDDVLLWARAGTLSQFHDFDIPVALLVPHASGARAGIISIPVVTTSQPAPNGSFPQRASVFVNKVVQVLRKP